MKSTRVLVLYTASEYPTRKTTWSFLRSFALSKNALIYYHNMSVSFFPSILKQIEFDLIIYSHFLTAPWNKRSYENKIAILKNAGIKSQRRIAFFQDEYVNTELMCKFINELNVDTVYSVAPKSELSKIYSSVYRKNINFRSYLTGYVDENDIIYCQKKSKTTSKVIDVGYRTGWPSSEIFRLGYWGSLKYLIAEKFLSSPSKLKLDIKVGSDQIHGKKWFQFLLRCKYSLGVESRASLHDPNGSIYSCIKKEVLKNPNISFEEVQEKCFSNKDFNIDLRAISPRVFEAAIARSCLVLTKGHYNGLLQPWVHYIPLEPDFSDIQAVIAAIENDTYRESLVENTYRDLIASEQFTYRKFIERFFESELEGLPVTYIGTKDILILYINRFKELTFWVALATLTILKKIRLSFLHQRKRTAI